MDFLSTIVGTSDCLLLLDHLLPQIAYYLTLKTILSASLLTLLWYYLFWKPLDFKRDFTDLGFEEANRSYAHYKDITRKNVINELRDRRKIGDLPPVYPNGWFAILESDQLKHRGVKEVSVLGMNLVAWRGTSGKAYVSDAYCPHLGAHLGVGGTVSQECITCPFHGWQFEGSTGCLTNIPYSTNNSSLDQTDFAKIKMKTVLEQNSFIYLWYHAEGEKPSWYPAIVPEIDSGKWVYRGRSEFRVACHIQEIPENGADISHLNVLHVPALMTGGTPQESFFQWGGVKHVWSGEWRALDEKGQKHIAIMDVSHHVNILNVLPFMQMEVRAIQIGPGVVHLEFNTALGKGVMLHMVTPQGPLLQKVTHRFYTCRTLVHPWAKLIILGEAIMMSRDVSIWNRKTFLKNPTLPKEDSTIKKYRKWYSQFYSDNSPRHYFAKNDGRDGDLGF